MIQSHNSTMNHILKESHFHVIDYCNMLSKALSGHKVMRFRLDPVRRIGLSARLLRFLLIQFFYLYFSLFLVFLLFSTEVFLTAMVPFHYDLRMDCFNNQVVDRKTYFHLIVNFQIYFPRCFYIH